MESVIPKETKYDGIEKTVWNFKIYSLLEVVKDIKINLEISKQIEACTKMMRMTKVTLEQSQKYFQFTDCFIPNQKYETLDVGSISEGVSIHQLFRDFYKDDIKHDNFDLSIEKDTNLCFRDVIAIDRVISKSVDESICSDSNPVMLEIFPSTVAVGHVNLALPASNTDYSAVQGLERLCVQDENGLTVLSSELLVNELYNILTLVTTLLNVQRCHLIQDGMIDTKQDLALFSSFQFVGQAGPAVHTASCIAHFTPNKHIFLTEDVSLSVPCKTWPNCASKWFLREKASGWPTKELIEKVLTDGCHLVPKYDPFGERDTPTEAAERASMTSWRYSFSLAEKTLMTSITGDQSLCYSIFKHLFTRYIKIPSIITTYTAKILFLWELESVPVDQWCFSRIGKRVRNLVEKLRCCIQNNFCEHYFIEGCNILQQLNSKTKQSTLEVSFPALYEDLSDEPIPEGGVLEVEAGFPFDLMTTRKSFYPILVYLGSLNAQANAKLYPPKQVPSPKNIGEFFDCTNPMEMTEILIYLVMADKVYGQPLPLSESLLQQQKVFEIVKFLKRSTPNEVFEELMKELDIELKFLHLQFKIFDETERFLTENPYFTYIFDHKNKEDE